SLVRLLRPDAFDAKRDRAAQLWREGTLAWEKRDLPRAEAFLQQAIDTDPTCAPPFVCLGIIAYQERGDYIAAEEYFERAIRRVSTEAQSEILRLAYYHLGRIREAALRFREAQGYYEKAIEIDPVYAEAWRELGGVVYRQALTQEGLPEERLERFRQAARIYETALERLAKRREELVFLTLDNLPGSSDLPFSSRAHNKGLRDQKRRFERFEGEFAYQIAVIRLATGERELAADWAKRAVESPQPLVDYHLLYAQILRELGREGDAQDQIKAARRLDPTHPRLK
ncbi:MAG: tetratricopeptide repeat protein, partial [Planctomycetes bacterium]|nr:tetratricopeptide repeat protein [Planctomycetota bacterium]